MPGYDIPLPRIQDADAQTQMAQMRSYLYQMVEQLNFVLNSLSRETTEILTVTETKDAVKDKAQEAYDNFNEIKSLIIKSADIVNSYYDQMQTRLSGDYVAQSEFGTYRSETQNTINANSDGITQLFENMQAIESGVSEITDNVRTVLANIKTGLLYTDEHGNPVYGLEVGQRNIEDGVETFHKYARFTSNRLSFYDQNDMEVAYISDYKLYITQAQITGSITVGRYVLDTSNGLAFRWV